jgi:hypothetical protein
MLNQRRRLFFGVTRIRSIFKDDLNPPSIGTGTGFWLTLRSGKICFITNRHNIDPTLQFPQKPAFRLESVSLEVRKSTGDASNPTIHTETQFFPVEDGSLLINSDADCAIVLPKFAKLTDGYRIMTDFEESDLAPEEFFDTTLPPAQSLFFIGFPGRPANNLLNQKATTWWDTKWNLPIIRSAILASMPFFRFENPAIKTGDVLLVSGMSFEGSSGSPVISHEIGIKVQPPLKANYVPEKIIGIMSGHWWSEKDFPDVFKHSGLSYLTRSTSILHLIQANGL